MKEVKLPDFDDMVEIANQIGLKKTEYVLCKNEIDLMVARITQVVTTEEKYQVGGKTPSMTYIADTYQKFGTNEEEQAKLLELRSKLAVLEGELKATESLFEIYRDMIGVWRTESANKRGAFLE